MHLLPCGDPLLRGAVGAPDDGGDLDAAGPYRWHVPRHAADDGLAQRGGGTGATDDRDDLIGGE
jgi:hypothetical protein